MRSVEYADDPKKYRDPGPRTRRREPLFSHNPKAEAALSLGTAGLANYGLGTAGLANYG